MSKPMALNKIMRAAAALILLLAGVSVAQAQTAGAAFIYGHYTFLTDAGAPASGYKLCTYAAGTSTPQSTWADSGLVTLNANPVIMNTAGRASNGSSEVGIYFSGLNYKLVFRQPGTTTDCTTGSIVWTADNQQDLANVFFNTTRTANTVYAGPSSGSAAIPTFRALSGADLPPNVITTTSTGTQNDFAPGLVSGVLNVLRCNNATLLTINGFSATSLATGTRLMLASIGAGQVDLAPQAGGSTAANRLLNFITSAPTSLAAGAGTAEYVYDGTTARWRLVTHDQGAFIDYAATSTVTGWSAFATDGKHIWYWANGRQITTFFLIEGTSNATTASFTMPYTAGAMGVSTVSSTVMGPATFALGAALDNAAFLTAPSHGNILSASAIVNLYSTLGGGGWTASNTKSISGTFTYWTN
jgi:hypothetical protein